MHHGRDAETPLVLPGPWDAGSARAFVDAGFPALATPSAGIAASLGFQDGRTPAEEMFAAVARIVRAVEVPVSADLESGYGLDAKELVERLLETGAVGCNLEDSVDGELLETARRGGLPRGGPECTALGPEPFLNARVDAYLRGAADPLAEALARGRAYVEAGADGIYPFGAPGVRSAGAGPRAGRRGQRECACPTARPRPPSRRRAPPASPTAAASPPRPSTRSGLSPRRFRSFDFRSPR